MTDRKLRAGIVGAGLIARQKHIPAFARDRGRVELVALCDIERLNAEKVAREHHIDGAYTDPLEMIERERLDLIDICTPPRTHADLAIAALDAGCHVLIEKPMAHSLADCDRIVAAAAATRAKACVAHSSLFYPVMMQARALVSAGAIGAVRGVRVFLSTPTHYMTARESHWAHRLPGGVVGESGPHPVYLSLAFVNSIRDVQVSAVKILPQYPWSPFEDYRIDLIGESAISSIALTYASDQWAARMDIIGETGMLLLDLEGRTLVHYNRTTLSAWPLGRTVFSEARQVASSIVKSGLEFVTGKLPSTHERLLKGFVDSIINDTPPPCTAQDGREAVRVLDLIVERIDALAAASVRR